MQPVTQLNELGESVMYFMGKTLDDAKLSAQNFAKERGAEAQRYFVQSPFGGSKMVSIIADFAMQ